MQAEGTFWLLAESMGMERTWTEAQTINLSTWETEAWLYDWWIQFQELVAVSVKHVNDATNSVKGCTAAETRGERLLSATTSAQIALGLELPTEVHSKLLEYTAEITS